MSLLIATLFWTVINSHAINEQFSINSSLDWKGRYSGFSHTSSTNKVTTNPNSLELQNFVNNLHVPQKNRSLSIFLTNQFKIEFEFQYGKSLSHKFTISRDHLTEVFWHFRIFRTMLYCDIKFSKSATNNIKRFCKESLSLEWSWFCF